MDTDEPAAGALMPFPGENFPVVAGNFQRAVCAEPAILERFEYLLIWVNEFVWLWSSTSFEGGGGHEAVVSGHTRTHRQGVCGL